MLRGISSHCTMSVRLLLRLLVMALVTTLSAIAELATLAVLAVLATLVLRAVATHVGKIILCTQRDLLLLQMLFICIRNFRLSCQQASLLLLNSFFLVEQILLETFVGILDILDSRYQSGVKTLYNRRLEVSSFQNSGF